MTDLIIDNETNFIESILENLEEKPKEPSFYSISIIDDSVTSMQFVIDVITNHFGKSEDEAYDAMMQVHLTGNCDFGKFTKDIALSKISNINKSSRQEGFTLKLELVKI